MGFSGDEAVAEAERCLNCGVPFGLRTCWFCLPCEIECPEKALYVKFPIFFGEQQPARRLKRASSPVPLRRGRKEWTERPTVSRSSSP